MVELSNIQKSASKDIVLTVRTTKENKEWMESNNISPSLFFDEAIIDLKKKMRDRVHRDNCVMCKNPTKEVKLGIGMETFSFCSARCMKAYVTTHPSGNGLEVKGTRIYVK